MYFNYFEQQGHPPLIASPSDAICSGHRMLPESNIYGGWPASGEIDIMEHVNADGKFYGTLHYGSTTGATHKGGQC